MGTAPELLWGIDGCRGGWLAVGFSTQRSLRSMKLFESLASSEALTLLHSAKSVFIDIPIGLPNSRLTSRTCDRAARRLLGPRRSSVFSPPARSTLEVGNYPAANRRNREVTGKGLSKQSFYILPKIKEVDLLFQKRGVSQGVLKESHPEVCFALLSKGKIQLGSKRSCEGRQQRIRLLGDYVGTDVVADLLQRSRELKRRGVGEDDLLDAAVLAYSASFGSSLSVLGEGEIDETGLRMEIVVPSLESGEGTREDCVSINSSYALSFRK